jgi:hypothetical protein
MRKAIASNCLDCGLSHEPKRRQRALLRMLPCEKQELVAAFPCWWGGKGNGSADLAADLHAVGQC